ncbi:MAG: hypothetical protein V7752_07775 [Halopseudomonas sp.]
MNKCYRMLQWASLLLLSVTLTGCNDPQVYGSIGVSSSYSSYNGYHRSSGPRMRGSISVGGRIR